MDKFYRYSIITIVVIVLVCMAMGYVGYTVGGNKATDDQVNELGGGGTTVSPFTIEGFGENGEYVGFGIVGAAGGFVVGYIFPTLFGNTNTQRRKD
jgi:hypothetical protein